MLEGERRILNSFSSFLLFIRKGEVYNKKIELQEISHLFIFGSDPRTQKNMRNYSLIYLSSMIYGYLLNVFVMMKLVPV